MKKKEVARCVAAIRRFHKEHKRLPYMAELVAYGLAEWEIRQCGGISGLAHMAKLADPHAQSEIKFASALEEKQKLKDQIELKYRSATEEIQTLKKRINELLGKKEIKDAMALEKMEKQLRETDQKLRVASIQAITSNEIRDLIGTLDMDQLGHEAEWLTPKKPTGKSHGTPILNVSDIHHSEVVDPNQVNGKNEFNSEISVRRIKAVFRNAIEFLKYHISSPSYDGVVVNLIGDLLSGLIHEELSETNDKTINESVFELADLLCVCIGELVDEFKKVHVVAVTGNHGRFYKKPRAKNAAKDNWEWIIYQLIARYFKNDPRVTFLIPEGLDAIFSVYNKRIITTHGQNFQGGDGVTGVLSAVMRGFAKKQEKQVAMGEAFDMMFIGHFHTLVWYKSLFINGSIKGLDEYSDMKNYGYEPPQQGLCLIHPDHGMTIRTPIFCEDRPKKKG